MRLTQLCLALLSVLATANVLQAADGERLPLKLNLTKGESHHVAFQFRTDLAGKDGKMAPMRNVEADIKLTVVDVDEKGNASIEVRFERLLSFFVNDSDYDSQAPKDSKRGKSRLANALFDFPMTYTISPTGELSPKVKGMARVDEAFAEASAKTPIGEQDAFEVHSIVWINRFLWGVAFIKSPPNPVRIGESWTITAPAEKKEIGLPPFKSLKYTLKAHEKGTIELEVDVAAEERGRKAGPGIHFPFRIDLNDQTGWPKRAAAEIENKTPQATMKVRIETTD